RLAIVLGGTIVFGFVVRGIASVVWDRGTAGSSSGSGWLSSSIAHWVLLPENGTAIANWVFFALVIAIMIVTLVHGLRRTLLLIPTLYLAVFAWENLLFLEANISGATRLLLLGTVLVVLMNARPQGLFGTARVEIV